MISIGGQYWLETSPEVIKKTDLFIGYRVTGYLGLKLPTFTLEFTVHSLDETSNYPVGSILTISHGKSEELSDVDEMEIMNVKTIPDGRDSYRVVLSGVGKALNYKNKTTSKVYSGTSVDTLSAVASSDFRIDISAKTNDSMKWLQICDTNQHFMRDVYVHSYVSSSDAILTCITSSGTFRAHNISKLSSQKPTWEISSRDEGISISYGHVNEHNNTKPKLIGAGSSVRVLDYSTMTYSKESPDNTTLLLGSAEKVLPNTNDMLDFNSQSENTHDNYCRSLVTNKRVMAAITSSKVVVFINDSVDEYSVLDTILMMVDADDADTEVDSGIYIITGTDRYVNTEGITTYLKLGRESRE